MLLQQFLPAIAYVRSQQVHLSAGQCPGTQGAPRNQLFPHINHTIPYHTIILFQATRPIPTTQMLIYFKTSFKTDSAVNL